MTVEFATVVEPNPENRTAAAARRTGLVDVDVLLGRLQEATDWLAACQDSPQPKPLTRIRMVVIAGNHGNGAAAMTAGNPLGGSSAESRTVLDSIRDGSAPIARLARLADIGLIVAEVTGDDLSAAANMAGNPAEPSDSPTAGEAIDLAKSDEKRQSVHASQDADALSAKEFQRAVEIGTALADAEVDAGADLLIPAISGAGHAVPVLLLAAAITGMEPVDAVGLATEVDPAGWSDLVIAVRDGLFRAKREGGETTSLLRIGGGADLTVLTAFCAQAAVRRTPVVLDGVAALIAGVLATRLAPQANHYFIAAQDATSRIGRRLQELLGLSALTNLEVTAENGAAALQAAGLLNSAVHLLAGA